MAPPVTGGFAMISPSPVLTTSVVPAPCRLEGLQVLRGGAALFVVFFHFLPASGLATYLPGVAAVSRWGFSGVDLFFVLSGFVMWYSADQEKGAGVAARFLLKRLARIYLGYWPMLLLTILLFAVLAPRTLTEVNLAGSVFLTEPMDRRLVISVAWSLVYELYFYGLFAGLLLLDARVRTYIVLLAAVVIIVFNLWLYQFHLDWLDGGATEGFFVLSPFVVEFLSGSLLAVVFRRYVGRWHRSGMVAIGLVLAAGGLGLGTWEGNLPTHQIQRLPTFGVAAVGIMLAVLALGKAPWPRWATVLGNSSYSLYLGHPVVLTAATLWGIFPWSGTMVSGLIVSGVIVVGGGLAIGAYYSWVEMPLHRWSSCVIGRLSLRAARDYN